MCQCDVLALQGIVSVFLLVGICYVQALDISYSYLSRFFAGDEEILKKKKKIKN